MGVSGPHNVRDLYRDTTGQFQTSAESSEFVICTSSTRPSSPSAGNTIYETDTGILYVYDGSAWDQIRQTSDGVATSLLSGNVSAANAPSGSVITMATRTTSSQNGANYAFYSNNYCYITPQLSTSKILILTTLPINMVSQGSDVGFGYGIYSNQSGMLYQVAHSGGGYASTTATHTAHVNYVHQNRSVNPTSYQYYQIYLFPYTNNSGTYIYLNRNYQGTDQTTMTLLEIK